jgi:hypothetical protein
LQRCHSAGYISLIGYVEKIARRLHIIRLAAGGLDVVAVVDRRLGKELRAAGITEYSSWQRSLTHPQTGWNYSASCELFRRFGCFRQQWLRCGTLFMAAAGFTPFARAFDGTPGSRSSRARQPFHAKQIRTKRAVRAHFAVAAHSLAASALFCTRKTGLKQFLPEADVPATDR